MKRKIINILLCLLLVLSMAPAAYASTLDTTDLEIDGNTITISNGQNAILEALHAQGKTAKLAVPYSGSEEVYVLKDNATVVAHNFVKTGYIQFDTPGAGVYVIMTGTPATLEEQLDDQNKDIVLLSDDVLEDDHEVESGTVIHANGHTIKGEEESKKLYSEGDLTIENINGMEKISLGAYDAITFDVNGKAAIEAAIFDHGYGSVQVTMLDEDGEPVTRTFFLTEEESLTISKSGVISGNDTFLAAEEDAEHPDYRVAYASHDNIHVKGSSGKIKAECNGLYDYYTHITLQPKDSTMADVLAEKENGKDVVYASGVKVSEGSTILTLDDSYLDKLDVGEYILTFHYTDDGYAQSTLYVKQKASLADETNPKTGDGYWVPMAIMMASTAALTAVVLAKKKRA